jgi:hypothetical protein
MDLRPAHGRGKVAPRARPQYAEIIPAAAPPSDAQKANAVLNNVAVAKHSSEIAKIRMTKTSSGRTSGSQP